MVLRESDRRVGWKWATSTQFPRKATQFRGRRDVTKSSQDWIIASVSEITWYWIDSTLTSTISIQRNFFSLCKLPNWKHRSVSSWSSGSSSKTTRRRLLHFLSGFRLSTLKCCPLDFFQKVIYLIRSAYDVLFSGDYLLLPKSIRTVWVGAAIISVTSLTCFFLWSVSLTESTFLSCGTDEKVNSCAALRLFVGVFSARQ
jgi:hypothetical protein